AASFPLRTMAVSCVRSSALKVTTYFFMLRLLLKTFVLGTSEHTSTLFTLKISPDRLLGFLNTDARVRRHDAVRGRFCIMPALRRSLSRAKSQDSGQASAGMRDFLPQRATQTKSVLVLCRSLHFRSLGSPRARAEPGHALGSRAESLYQRALAILEQA